MAVNNDSTLGVNKDIPGIRNLTRFDGYFTNHYKNVLTSGTAFVFFTKPNLFLYQNPSNGVNNEYKNLAYENMCSDSYFSLFLNSEAINDQDKLIIENLSYISTLDSNFIKILTNECKNFDPQDTNIDAQDLLETKQGYRMQYGTHTVASRVNGQLSFQFTETANLDITKILSLWVKYIENISDGTFRANPDMVNKGILDYTSSIYYFLLGPDGHTLKYWAKYTGCWPANIPYSAFRYAKKDQSIVELSSTFNYMIKEDMDPRILEDFNRVSLGYLSYTDTYENSKNYDSFKDSALLSKTKLLTRFGSTINSDDRDPIVFFNQNDDIAKNSVDSQVSKFELSFGPRDMEYTFESEHFDYDSSIYNTDI